MSLTHKEEISLLEGRLEHEKEISHRLIEQKNEMWAALNTVPVMFFQWWSNQPGSNTEQGWHEYQQTKEYKKIVGGK